MEQAKLSFLFQVSHSQVALARHTSGMYFTHITTTSASPVHLLILLLCRYIAQEMRHQKEV